MSKQDWSPWMTAAMLSDEIDINISSVKQGNSLVGGGRYELQSRFAIDGGTGIQLDVRLFRYRDLCGGGVPGPESPMWFRYHRLKAGMSHADLAAKLGLKVSSVANGIDRGTHTPGLKTLRKWAHAVGIPRTEMLAWLEWYIYNKEEEA